MFISFEKRKLNKIFIIFILLLLNNILWNILFHKKRNFNYYKFINIKRNQLQIVKDSLDWDYSPKLFSLKQKMAVTTGYEHKNSKDNHWDTACAMALQ